MQSGGIIIDQHKGVTYRIMKSYYSEGDYGYSIHGREGWTFDNGSVGAARRAAEAEIDKMIPDPQDDDDGQLPSLGFGKRYG